MTAQIRIARPSTDAQKTTQTTLDTWTIDVATAKEWKLPPFQRPLRESTKVSDLASEMAHDALATKAREVVIPGVFCIGRLEGELYLVDGQHRRHSFIRAAEIVAAQDKSQALTGYVDVRVIHFDTIAEMAAEFVRLNSRLVNMRADDVLRGMESSSEPMQRLRKACPFIGYDNIRRNDKSPILSMATALRTWIGSAHDVPHTSGTGVAQLAAELTGEQARALVEFLECAITAWGRDGACSRLWGTLNLILCAWLYRRLVLQEPAVKTKLTKEQFACCLMSLGSEAAYVDWLVGRNLNTRDLGPAYDRIKALFVSRLERDTRVKHKLPAPPWSSNKGGGR